MVQNTLTRGGKRASLRRQTAEPGRTDGPSIAPCQIDPGNVAGGAPGGNIRRGHLFRADRGPCFVDPGGRPHIH